MIAAARERGIDGDRRARAGLAGDPEPLRRGHRHQRQDDHGRAARPPLPRRPASRSRSPATSARRSPRWSARSTPDATVVCECSSFQLEDTEAFAPECAVFLNLAPDHLDRHGDLERLPRPRSCGSSPTRATTTSPSTTATSRRSPDVDLGGCARRVALLPRRRPRLRGRARRGRRSSGDGEPLLEADELRPARRAQRRQRDGRRRRGAGDGARPRRGRATGCAASPASRTGSSRSPRSAASSSSTTPRRPTSPRPTVGAARLRRRRPRDPRRQRARASRSRRWSSRSRERCGACYLIGEAAGAPGAELAPVGDAGVDAAPLRGPRGRGRSAAAAARGPGEVVLLSPACASFDAFATSSSAASASARSSEALR